MRTKAIGPRTRSAYPRSSKTPNSAQNLESKSCPPHLRPVRQNSNTPGYPGSPYVKNYFVLIKPPVCSFRMLPVRITKAGIRCCTVDEGTRRRTFLRARTRQKRCREVNLSYIAPVFRQRETFVFCKFLNKRQPWNRSGRQHSRMSSASVGLSRSCGRGLERKPARFSRDSQEPSHTAHGLEDQSKPPLLFPHLRPTLS